MKWNPVDYAQNSDAQLKWARELRADLNLRGDESLLDVGCGDGKITADFALALPQGKVIGIDSSPEMIAYATNTYPTDRYPNLSFAVVDARRINFDLQFDLCFSNATLHWVDDHRAFLAGASRSLVTGGRLIISAGGEGNAADILAVFAELTAEPDWQAYFDTFQNPYFFHSDRDYRTWLQQAELEIERLELVPKDMIHRDRSALASWIRTTWMPFNERVPAAKRAAFIDRFVDLYLHKIPVDRDGATHVAMVRLEVNAVRTQNPKPHPH